MKKQETERNAACVMRHADHALRVTHYALLCVIAIALLTSCAPSKEKPLQTVKVTKGNILAQLPVTGAVVPRNRLGIKPPVAGRIEQVLVAEGQHVKKGEVLAWMSSSERAALLDAAREKGPDEVKYWEDVYKPAPIVAPLAGFIIVGTVQPGQFFSLSDDVLVMADRLIVQAQVDETDIGRVKLNQNATIKLDAYPDQAIPGIVEQIAYESQTINNVTVYMVNILPGSVPAFFRSGMSATINFEMDERQGVLTLPVTAVKKANGRSYVFTQQNGKIKAVQVQTGLENNDSLEVLSGVAEGDTVIIPTKKIADDALAQGGPRGGPFGFLGGGRRGAGR
ncbi:MAG TPA: HlyD family efflux transporter periplasmic adaptor subunit [Candidatus Sulfotelmatobacter sp.]|nr:HlyD family efflux transporter periplasmic adaptor subunit [Candidatus Sulfotelmatobacter sp.]